jgi:hypothetical protein
LGTKPQMIDRQNSWTTTDIQAGAFREPKLGAVYV